MSRLDRLYEKHVVNPYADSRANLDKAALKEFDKLLNAALKKLGISELASQLEFTSEDITEGYARFKEDSYDYGSSGYRRKKTVERVQNVALRDKEGQPLRAITAKLALGDGQSIDFNLVYAVKRKNGIAREVAGVVGMVVDDGMFLRVAFCGDTAWHLGSQGLKYKKGTEPTIEKALDALRMHTRTLSPSLQEFLVQKEQELQLEDERKELARIVKDNATFQERLGDVAELAGLDRRDFIISADDHGNEFAHVILDDGIDLCVIRSGSSDGRVSLACYVGETVDALLPSKEPVASITFTKRDGRDRLKNPTQSWVVKIEKGRWRDERLTPEGFRTLYLQRAYALRDQRVEQLLREHKEQQLDQARAAGVQLEVAGEAPSTEYLLPNAAERTIAQEAPELR